MNASAEWPTNWEGAGCKVEAGHVFLRSVGVPPASEGGVLAASYCLVTGVGTRTETVLSLAAGTAALQRATNLPLRPTKWEGEGCRRVGQASRLSPFPGLLHTKRGGAFDSPKPLKRGIFEFRNRRDTCPTESFPLNLNPFSRVSYVSWLNFGSQPETRNFYHVPRGGTRN
jgi:hypothetical protein